MQLILAIDSDPRRSEQLKALVRARLAVDLVQATSAGEGLHALKDRVPDLILTAPLLSPFDDGVLDEYLRDLGAAATHVQTVRIPMLSAAPKKKSTASRLFGLGGKKKQTSSAAPDGCDPKVFADEIAHYLTRSLEERSASAIKSAATPAPADSLLSRPDAPWIEDVVQPEQLIEPEALIEEFTVPIAAEPAPIQTSPVVEQVYVPGAILDLRPTPVEARNSETMVEPDPLFAKPEVRAFVEPEVPFVEPDLHAFVEPDVHAFLKPDVRSFIEPDVHPFLKPEVRAFVEPEVDAFVEPEVHAFVEPEPQVIIVEPVVPTADSLAAVNPQSVSAPSAPQTPGGTSASFEAALAAIRAAWAKPEDKKPVVSARPNEPTSGSPKPKLAGAADVDLTNQIDALEDAVGADGLVPAAGDESSPDESKTPAERRKVDKARKHPEKARGHKLRGQDAWGVFDPNQRGFSTLVKTLDDGTEDEVTTVRATTIVR